MHLRSRAAEARVGHISTTNFFETKLSPETDSAGLSETTFNLIFTQLLGGGDRQNFRSNHQYCIPDLGIVAEEFSGAGSVHPNQIISTVYPIWELWLKNLVARDLSIQIRVELAPDL